MKTFEFPTVVAMHFLSHKSDGANHKWTEGMDDDVNFPSRPRLMTFPGTSRLPLSRPRLPRLPPITPKSAAEGFKSSLASGEIWVVQVSSSAQSTKKQKVNGHVSHESLHHTLEEDDKEGQSIDSIQSEQRAVALLSREYDSVLSNATTATKLASEVHENTSRSGSSERNANNVPDTMISGMVPALFLGQCFSLLGVSNAACRNGQNPVFRWFSLRLLFSAVVSLSLVVNAIFAICDLLNRNEMTLGGSQVVVFYLSSFAASCLYVRLATQWASLCSAFESMENRVSFYGDSNGLRRWMRILTGVVLTLALVEHALAQLNTFIYMSQTMSNHSAGVWLQSYFEGNFPHVHYFIPFSPLIGAATIAVNLTSTFIWNYNDLFIMLISLAISWRFRLLNNSLIQTAHENKDVKSWRQSRETYNAISTLTRTVDRSISVHVLLSFVNNFYFICLQLLHTVRHEKNTLYQNIYFAFSFGFLLSRAVAVSLFASSIFEESRAFKRVLFAVSAESYCDEVDRFLVQVTTDDVALTGCNFFNVTRSLLLTVVGTITTYEVVLVQFNGLNSNN